MNSMKWYWHALLFNVMWLLCVKGGNTAALALLPYAVLYRAEMYRFRFLVPAIVLALLACTADLLLEQYGFIVFFQRPYWLLVLWLAFILSFNSIYGALIRRFGFYFVPMGGVFGPLCYLSGVQLGALMVNHNVVYFIWAALWAFYFSYLVFLTPRT